MSGGAAREAVLATTITDLKAWGPFRTSTRPTLNRLLLFHASV